MSKKGLKTINFSNKSANAKKSSFADSSEQIIIVKILSPTNTLEILPLKCNPLVNKANCPDCPLKDICKHYCDNSTGNMGNNAWKPLAQTKKIRLRPLAETSLNVRISLGIQKCNNKGKYGRPSTRRNK